MEKPFSPEPSNEKKNIFYLLKLMGFVILKKKRSATKNKKKEKKKKNVDFEKQQERWILKKFELGIDFCLEYILNDIPMEIYI